MTTNTTTTTITATTIEGMMTIVIRITTIEEIVTGEVGGASSRLRDSSSHH